MSFPRRAERARAARRARAASAGRALGIVGLLLPAVLVITAPAALGFTPQLKAAYTAGCQGVATGTKIFSHSGTTSGGVYTYSNAKGVSRGGEGARASNGGASAIFAGAYYFVGPAPTGCMSTASGASGLKMTWKWRVTADPYLAANCSGGDQVNAQATVQLIVLGNVHWMVPPYYIFIPHRQASPDPVLANVTCTGGGSNVYAPGSLGPYNVTIHSPTFSLAAMTSYDIYSSVYGNNTATTTGNATAVSLMTVSARFLGVSCPGCPP